MREWVESRKVEGRKVEGRKVGRSKVESRKPQVLLLCLFVAFTGCKENADEQTPPAAPVLSQQYRQGELALAVSLSETNIPSSGSIRLVLDAQAPVDSEVVFPEIGNLIGLFRIADRYTDPPRTLPSGKILHRCVWQLVPGLPGEVVFQPLEIAAGATTIKTETIAVSVDSLLPPGLAGFEIRDITAPATLLPGQGKLQQQWLLFLGIATAAALAALCIGLARRPKRIVVLPPHEQAFQALENLPAEPLERIHTLSEILLAFIGGRFKLPTLGKTINEVVPLLPKKALLGRRHKLEKFLLEAEGIRFSNRVPTGFPEGYEQYVRNFVEKMKQEAPCG